MRHTAYGWETYPATYGNSRLHDTHQEALERLSRTRDAKNAIRASQGKELVVPLSIPELASRAYQNRDEQERVGALKKFTVVGQGYNRSVATNVTSYYNAKRKGDHEAATRWLERAEVHAGVRKPEDTQDHTESQETARVGMLRGRIRAGDTEGISDEDLKKVRDGGIMDPQAWEHANNELERRAKTPKAEHWKNLTTFRNPDALARQGGKKARVGDIVILHTARGKRVVNAQFVDDPHVTHSLAQVTSVEKGGRIKRMRHLDSSNGVQNGYEFRPGSAATVLDQTNLNQSGVNSEADYNDYNVNEDIGKLHRVIKRNRTGYIRHGQGKA